MIPNILTTFRLILVPVFAYLMLGTQNYIAAAAVFVLSGITDVVDGYIARKFHMETDFGKIYDPFVDKLMQITAVVCLVISKIMPRWLLILVVVKEGIMIIVGGILYIKKIVVKSNWCGKTSTVVFYIGVILFIIWKDMPPVVMGIVLTVMVLAMIMAAAFYTVDIIKHHDKNRVKKSDK